MSIDKETKKADKRLANLTGGSRKGKPNKLNAEVKEMILQALNNAGGVDYLVRQADEKPVAFLALVGKVLPLQVHGAGENGEHLFKEIKVTLVSSDAT